MKSVEQTKQIIQLAKTKLGWEENEGILSRGQPPFDISKPNFHDNKSDFEAEKTTIQELIGSCNSILRILSENQFSQGTPYEDVKFNPLIAIDVKAKMNSPKAIYSAIDAISLIQRNVVETGLTRNAEVLLTELRDNCLLRLSDLDAQEGEFWAGTGRPAHHYARAIALRFGKFYAKQMKVKPTIGVSRDGPIPSTDFGRLLEEVFTILEIETNFRNAGEWAISQLGEDDWKPPQSGLSGLFSLRPKIGL